MTGSKAMDGGKASDGDGSDRLYAEACAVYAPALARLARSVESDPDRARDLEQDIHLALWRSFDGFDGRCALGTWVYRVAHNTAAGHAACGARAAKLVAIEDAGELLSAENPERAVGATRAVDRLRALIARLRPADRTIILLYLEGLEAAAIGEIAGLSSGNVATKVHRIKSLLAAHFASGDPS